MEERLKLFLAMEGLSPSQFADKLGVQRSGVSHLLAGRNKPSFEFISKMLAAYPKLNPDWLIMGTGKAYRDTPEAGIAGQAGNDALTQASNDASIQASSDEFSHTQLGDRHTRLDRVSEASLQEDTVNDDMPDLFASPAQPQTPPAPEPKPQVTAPKPPAPPQKKPDPAPIQPAAGKHIAQITILYTDGTYEVR
ncbi:MAG: helix-turn-helix transcriptional regulator [Bacteroidales bacterium]|nr:helix-turn-helix transcriptional regulator [Bacteroidales bacterium]